MYTASWTLPVWNTAYANAAMKYSQFTLDNVNNGGRYLYSTSSMFKRFLMVRSLYQDDKTA